MNCKRTSFSGVSPFYFIPYSVPCKKALVFKGFRKCKIGGFFGRSPHPLRSRARYGSEGCSWRPIGSFTVWRKAWRYRGVSWCAIGAITAPASTHTTSHGGIAGTTSTTIGPERPTEWITPCYLVSEARQHERRPHPPHPNSGILGLYGLTAPNKRSRKESGWGGRIPCFSIAFFGFPAALSKLGHFLGHFSGWVQAVLGSRRRPFWVGHRRHPSHP